MSVAGDFQYPIHELCQKRWSPRAFQEKEIEFEKLRTLFEAARWAPSCFNDQPWRFLLGVKGQDSGYEKILDCLVESNRRWARTAPVLVLSLASLNFAYNQKPNRHALHDVGLAMGNLLVQATALDLFVHQMAGFDVARARESFRLPEGIEPVAVAAIGYLGEVELLPEELRAKENEVRTRRVVADFVFVDHWQKPWFSGE